MKTEHYRGHTIEVRASQKNGFWAAEITVSPDYYGPGLYDAHKIDQCNSETDAEVTVIRPPVGVNLMALLTKFHNTRCN